MGEGQEPEQWSRGCPPEKVKVQDPNEVGHSRFTLVIRKISDIFRQPGYEIIICKFTMGSGSTFDWSKGFPPRFLNPIADSDWFPVIFVENKQVLEFSVKTFSAFGLFLGDLVPRKCPISLSKIRLGEQLVPHWVCWGLTPIHCFLEGFHKGARSNLLESEPGKWSKDLVAGLGDNPNVTINESIICLKLPDQVWDMPKTNTTELSVPSSSKSKLPLPETFLKAMTVTKPTVKRTRKPRNQNNLKKSPKAEKSNNSEDSWSESESLTDVMENKENSEEAPNADVTNVDRAEQNVQDQEQPTGMTASWNDDDGDMDGPIFTNKQVVDENEEESVFELFGVNEALKQKIANLIESEILPLEVDEFSNVTIDEKDFVELRKQKKTTTTRFTLVAVADDDFEAEKPSQDIVDELLFLETGLGLPIEMIAQKPVLINKDGKERKVGGMIYPTGLKQKWELQVSTWVDLHLNIVCGKKEFKFGTGSDKWAIFAPGAYKNDEKSFYAHGVCPDPTITNVQIAKQLIRQGYEIHQGVRGVRDSPNQANFGAAKSGGKYFFLKTEMEKKENDEFNKIHIAVWSDNRKAKVQISFSVREKTDKSKKEATENTSKPKKCIACGNGEEKCTGFLGTNCSWRELIIADWIKAKKSQFETVTPFVKGATIVQEAPVNEAEQKVRKYLMKVKDDDDQQRKIRIRNFLVHNVQNEVKKQQLGEGKNIDDAGYVQVSRKKADKQRVLRRTIHKPYGTADFKNVASYTGGFGNKDKIIATLYKWPSRQHDGSRMKALMADFTLKQLSELVTKCGAKDNKSSTAVGKVEALKENLKRKEAYAAWIDEHVQALEMSICIQE